MGYRSEVGYVIQFKDVENLKKFVGIHAIDEHTREALNECDVSIPDLELRFTAQDVKWYESFDDVQAHEALLAFLDDDSCGIQAGYRFIRVGEDDDDNEHKYGGDDEYIPWGAIGLHRSIAWDVGVKTVGESTIAVVSEA